MFRFDQEREIGAVEDVEGGRAWVEQRQGVVGDDGFRNWWWGKDAIAVDTEELEEEKDRERKKEIARKQAQKAEKQREHKMMMAAKTKQKELLAEKRPSEMAERDEIRREAIRLAQIETAR